MGSPANSPRDTASAGSETDKTRAEEPVAEARGETQESKTVTWPTTNEPRSDGLQLAHEREQRRRSETLNPGPARGQDTAECTGVTCTRQTNMRQMAEHLRLKPGSQKTPTVAHDRRHGRTQRATTPPQLHRTPHQRRRQRDRREEQQVAEAAHKEQHRRLHRQAKAHLDGLPEPWPPTLTERPKRPPAPTGANRPTKPRKARRAWKRPRISRTQGVVGSKPLGDGGLQAPKIPENPVDFR